MSPVSCAEGVVNVDVSQFGQRRPESIDLLWRGFGLKINQGQKSQINWINTHRGFLLEE